VSAMHLSTEQMLQELEAQAQQMLERRHHHKKQQQKQRQTKQRHRQKQRAQGGSRPGGAAQASLPLLQHPRALLPRALLPTDANDAAAHTDFAPLFAARSGLALPIRTPAIQQLCDVGVKPHLGACCCMTATHLPLCSCLLHTTFSRFQIESGAPVFDLMLDDGGEDGLCSTRALSFLRRSSPPA
jgi:hypothetical protein